MANIDLIIKIPESRYRLLQKQARTNLGREKLSEFAEAVLNGTPLPKGHGRLIDADELKKHKYHDNNRFENAVAVAQIDWADTIIEADKGSE